MTTEVVVGIVSGGAGDGGCVSSGHGIIGGWWWKLAVPVVAKTVDHLTC